MEHAEAILDVVTILAFAALMFGVPILISRLLLRASWRAIAHAYAIWFGFLLAIGAIEAALGWALILAIFFTIPAVPIVILLLKLASILLKLARRIQNSWSQSTSPK